MIIDAANRAFVAGLSRMEYRKFLAYNVLGGVLWISLFLFAGYFFGNIPSVKTNFTLIIAAIIVISFLPPLVGYLRHRHQADKK